jgi:sigma-E factor negative regulatory protein RseA
MKEEISALVDGEANELERERALRALHTDPSMRDRWQRYHLASTAIRRELDVVVQHDFAERIREKLRHVTQDEAGRQFPSARVLRYTAGFAIAASVAAVAILSLPVVTAPQALSTAGNAAAPRSGMVAESQQAAELRRNLNPYLVRHAEFTPAASMNGMSAYARVVGRGAAATENTSGE